tara:strand:- start:9414 stop:10706 length:1293 start_codon:yes stop_codon:yes gene_type:complete
MNLTQEQTTEFRKEIEILKLAACQVYPLMSKAIMSAEFVPVYGLRDQSGNNWCVDEHNRIYVEFRVIVGPEKEKKTESVASILHEIQHPLMCHFSRFRSMRDENGDPISMRKVNIAADMALNCQYYLDTYLPSECIRVRHFSHKNPRARLETGETMEYYLKYADIPEEEEQASPEEEASGDSDFQDGDAVGDGERPWELGPPTDSNPGRTSEEMEEIQYETALDIQKASKTNPGSLPGEWIEWSGEVAGEAKIDWQDVFSQLLREAQEKVIGASAITYTRPNRRMSALYNDVVFPAYFEPSLVPALVVDSSGSMSDQDLTDCFQEIGTVLQMSASETFVVTGDTQVRFAQYVHNVSDIQIRGRGGTDMRPLFDRAVREDPNCIVVMTDGEFDFPREEDLNGIPLIVCLIGEFTKYFLPKWVHVVEVGDGE